MPSLLDRLFGGPTPPPPPAKAVSGPGAVAMLQDVPLESLQRSPQKLMARALEEYRRNGIVYAAQSLLSSKFGSVGFHVENGKGETLPDESLPPDLVRLLRRPNPFRTRSQLWRLSSRHVGLAGNGFLLFDQLNAELQPVAIYNVNPSRMWPAHSRDSGEQIGWILDADRPNGREPTPFGLEEIGHFCPDPPDDGVFGPGWIEAAWAELLLRRHATSHAAQSFASGGRLAGLMWPKEGVQLSDDQFNTWVRQVRAVTEDPNATKRMNLFKFPVEYERTAGTSAELNLPDLAELSRDDLLAIAKVPKSQLGMEVAAGLNSGEKGKYEEAALWQNAIEPVLMPFAELLQERVVTPFGDYTLVVEVPEFDDQAPLYENAEKSKVVPLTIDQRLALVGLDPLDEGVYGKLGQAIYIDQSMVPVWNALDSDRSDTSDEGMDKPGELAAKATLHFEDVHRRLAGAYLPRLNAAVSEALGKQRDEIAGRLQRSADHLASKPGDVSVWWDEAREYRRLSLAVEPLVADLAREVAAKTGATFFRPAKADPFLDRVLDYIRVRVGERIRGINDYTRDEVRRHIEDGIRAGSSPGQIASELDPLFGESRAERIARTETAYALNDGAIGTYRAFDVEQVEVIDGDADDICAPVNGAVWSLEQAASNPVGHPNCTRDFIPLVKARLSEPVQPAPVDSGIHIHLPESLTHHMQLPTPQVTVNVPDFPAIPAPIVNVAAPQVTLPPFPEIPAPVVNVAAAKATLPAEVRVVSMPNRVHKVIRSGDEVVGSLEEDD